MRYMLLCTDWWSRDDEFKTIYFITFDLILKLFDDNRLSLN